MADKEPKIDFKVLDEAVRKVLAYGPKKKPPASPPTPDTPAASR